MGSRIPFAVPVLAALPGNRLLQSCHHVPLHVRIRPFLDRDRGGGVRHKDMQQTIPPAAPGGGLLQ